MTDRDRYQATADRLWPEVRRLFNFPLLEGVRVTGTERDPAPGQWDGDVIVLSRDHLDTLDPGPDELSTVVGAALKHEVGHYAFFPRELVDHLRYLARAEEVFGEGRGYRYYARYADACVELRLLKHRICGEELLRYRARTAEAYAAADDVPETEGEVVRRIGRLLAALYAETVEGLPSVVSPTAGERTHLDRLGAIDYFADAPAAHEGNLVRFGNALSAALADLPGEAILGVETPEDRGKGAGRPFAGDAVERVPDAALDEALSDAAAEERWVYERIRDFLEERAGFEEDVERGGAAGLERGRVEPHDDLVPFYRRWATEFPVYLTRKEQDVVETELYRSGRDPYEVGDPLNRLNPFASLGVLGVPGVSTVDRFEEGELHASRSDLPDLLVGIDSSGSMPHPGEESVPVLAAFVLARSYYRNGASVGGYNFSGGIAFLPPGRDLDALYSLLCSRWGGGTVLDREALVGFADRMDDLDGSVVSDPEGHEPMLERELEGESGDGDRDRNEHGNDPDAGAFGRLDHVLITDGDIANEEAVVSFIERLPETARTFLFLTDGDGYERWVDRSLPNTYVYAATAESDLTDLALGLAKARATGGTAFADEGEGVGDRTETTASEDERSRG